MPEESDVRSRILLVGARHAVRLPSQKNYPTANDAASIFVATFATSRCSKILYTSHMKKIVLLSLLLVACSQDIQENSMQPKVQKAFSMPEVGMHSDKEKPDFIQVEAHSKFDSWGTQEPVFEERIGLLVLEKFCPKEEKNSGNIILDCRFVAGQSPHVEFYFSEFNPYNDNFEVAKKYVLFQTKSILKPIVSISLPVSVSLSSEEWADRTVVIKAMQKEIAALKNSEDMRSLSEFVNSIQFDDVSALENEWLTYTNKPLHFSFDYPNGGYIREPAYESGADISFERFTIIYKTDKKSADETINEYSKNRRVEKTPATIGRYPAEKISFSQKDSSYSTFEIYVIPSPRGFFIISYDRVYKSSEYLKRTLDSFTILD